MSFNVYMYDGNHDESSHFEALNHFLLCLDEVFIDIVDDWNCTDVQNDTYRSFEDNNVELIWKKEQLTTLDGSHPPKDQAPFQRAKSLWHKGIAIFVLKKP